MQRVAGLLMMAAVLLAACVPTALVAGAEKVRITSNPADIANCKAVGNLTEPKPDINVIPDNVIRDQTVGFGGNTAFLTAGAGIAYQCP